MALALKAVLQGGECGRSRIEAAFPGGPEPRRNRRGPGAVAVPGATGPGLENGAVPALLRAPGSRPSRRTTAIEPGQPDRCPPDGPFHSTPMLENARDPLTASRPSRNGGTLHVVAGHRSRRDRGPFSLGLMIHAAPDKGRIKIVVAGPLPIVTILIGWDGPYRSALTGPIMAPGRRTRPDGQVERHQGRYPPVYHTAWQ